jgi:hypothetical protein
MPFLQRVIIKYARLPKAKGQVFTASSIPSRLINRHYTKGWYTGDPQDIKEFLKIQIWDEKRNRERR